MNFKHLITILLCFKTIFAETDYEGECKELEQILKKSGPDESLISLNNCALDDKDNAVD